MNIRMSEKERILLNDCLSKSTNYLEYGSGGSTLLACSTSNINIIHSVESDLGFINELSKEDPIVENIQNNRLKFHFANIGETGSWGIPSNKEKVHRWPLYPLMPFTDFKNQTNYDLVLIDGRFRVACAIAVALENPNCTVLIHDYFKRPQYWILERVFEITNRIDTLVELRFKNDISPMLLTNMFCKFCYMPSDKRGIYHIKIVRNFLKQFRKGIRSC
jgi:hypothetical protein